MHADETPIGEPDFMSQWISIEASEEELHIPHGMEYLPIYSKVLVRIQGDGWNKGYIFEAFSSVLLHQDSKKACGVFYYVDNTHVVIFIVKDPTSNQLRANCMGR